MKILFIDDQQRRFREFRPNAFRHSISLEQTATDAILALNSSPDVIFLDYDLSEDPEVLESPHYRDGEAIAHEIASRNFAGIVVIHSLNSEGSEKIRAVLDAAGIPCIARPWAWREPVEDVLKLFEKDPIG